MISGYNWNHILEKWFWSSIILTCFIGGAPCSNKPTWKFQSGPNDAWLNGSSKSMGAKQQWSICLSVKLGYCTFFFWLIRVFSTWAWHQIGRPRVRSCMIHLSKESEGSRKKGSWLYFLWVLNIATHFWVTNDNRKIMENREILGLGFLGLLGSPA